MKEPLSIGKRIKNIAPVRLIVISFALVILIGATLLTLPISARDGQATNFVDALFTATSATCVTGLVVVDTWTHFNGFGQAVILFLIQVGGLGIVTFTTGFTVLMRRKLSLKDMMLASENTSGSGLEIPRLLKTILVFTVTAELIGALILMIRFVPKFGGYGVWISIFLAVSGYCNAGFDVLGFELKDGSLTNYAGDPLVSVTLALLIILGGLGFIAISDVYFKKVFPHIQRIYHRNKMRSKQKKVGLNFHTQVVLMTTATLLVIGTGVILLCEWDNTMSHLNWGEKINAAFFQSASARTAGYASINIGGERSITQVFTILLMFIGASSASTGGGIKTTTLVVLLATVFSVMRGNEDTVLLRRMIDKATVYRALAITFAGMIIVAVPTVIIETTNHNVGFLASLFESVSAFSTTGLTMGITPTLNIASKLALTFAMFAGRVGPVSLALALAMRKGRHSSSVLPEGKIIVG